MTTVLLKNAHIVDGTASERSDRVNVLIENSIVRDMGKAVSSASANEPAMKTVLITLGHACDILAGPRELVQTRDLWSIRQLLPALVRPSRRVSRMVDFREVSVAYAARKGLGRR